MPTLEENIDRYKRYGFPTANSAALGGLEGIAAETTPIVTAEFTETVDASASPEYLAEIAGPHGLAVFVAGEVGKTVQETRKVKEEGLQQYYVVPVSGNVVGLITYSPPGRPDDVLEGMESQVSSPFDELQAQRDKDLTYIVSHVVGSWDLSYSRKLSDRLESLLQIAKDEQELVAAESLTNFLSFLQSERPLRRPSVFLTPRGNFRAQWRKAPDQHFAMEFLPSGKVRSVLFAADLEQPNLIARTAAITSRDAVMKSVEVYGVRDWMSK